MNQNETLLSFIVPVYNVEQYLEECLDSLIAQDIPCDEYEILCIDDGSTDKSGEIIDFYAEKYPNVVAIHKENGGVGSARNHAISLARGKYIWFVDSDDFIRDNCLQELKAFMNQNHDIINIRAYRFNECLTAEEKNLLNQNRLETNITYWGYTWLHLYKTDTIRNNNVVFMNDLKYGEDEMFYNDVVEYSDSIIDLTTAYYFYRANPLSAMKSLSQRKNKIKRVEDIIRSITILKKNLETGKQTKDFTKYFFQARYRLLEVCLYECNTMDAFPLFRKLRKERVFDLEKLSELDIPARGTIMVRYFKKRAEKCIASIARKILPGFLKKFVKKIFHKK